MKQWIAVAALVLLGPTVHGKDNGRFLIRTVSLSDEAILRYAPSSADGDIASRIIRSYRKSSSTFRPSPGVAKQITIISESPSSAVIAYPEALKDFIERGVSGLVIDEFQLTRQRNAIAISRSELALLKRKGYQLIFGEYHFIGISPSSDVFSENQNLTPKREAELLRRLQLEGEHFFRSSGNTLLLAVPESEVQSSFQRLVNNGIFNILASSPVAIKRLPANPSGTDLCALAIQR
jgi:hypothetical protein